MTNPTTQPTNTPQSTAGEAVLKIGDHTRTFTSRKRLRKFLRKRGSTIKHFYTTPEGITQPLPGYTPEIDLTPAPPKSE